MSEPAKSPPLPFLVLMAATVVMAVWTIIDREAMKGWFLTAMGITSLWSAYEGRRQIWVTTIVALSAIILIYFGITETGILGR